MQLAALMLVGVVACTSARQPEAATRLSHVPRQVHSTRSKPPRSTSTTSDVVVAAPTDIRRCRVGDLHIAVPGSDISGTMPGTEAAIRLENISHTVCTLRGWPRVRALRSSGRAISANVIEDHGNGAWGWYRVVDIAVKPHRVVFASLLIGTPVTAQDNRGCRNVYTWRITAPGTDRSVVTSSARSRPGMMVCPNQTEIEVSPIHKGPPV
jgi:hypothetical protein